MIVKYKITYFYLPRITLIQEVQHDQFLNHGKGTILKSLILILLLCYVIIFILINIPNKKLYELIHWSIHPKEQSEGFIFRSGYCLSCLCTALVLEMTVSCDEDDWVILANFLSHQGLWQTSCSVFYNISDPQTWLLPKQFHLVA